MIKCITREILFEIYLIYLLCYDSKLGSHFSILVTRKQLYTVRIQESDR